MRNTINQLLIGLVTNVLWQAIIIITPLALGLIAWTQQQITSPIITLVLAVGWAGTSGLAIRAINQYRERSSERMVKLASVMFISDITIRKLIPNDLRNGHEEDIRKEIINLLSKMCQLLAYRISLTHKAATFIIVQENEGKLIFKLFAHFNHDSDFIYHTIEKILPNGKTLAGQVIEDGKCRIVHDSNRPEKDNNWLPTNKPSLYRGRAVAPVQVPIKGEPKTIGAVCLVLQL